MSKSTRNKMLTSSDKRMAWPSRGSPWGWRRWWGGSRQLPWLSKFFDELWDIPRSWKADLHEEELKIEKVWSEQNTIECENLGKWCGSPKLNHWLKNWVYCFLPKSLRHIIGWSPFPKTPGSLSDSIQVKKREHDNQKRPPRWSSQSPRWIEGEIIVTTLTYSRSPRWLEIVRAN